MLKLIFRVIEAIGSQTNAIKKRNVRGTAAFFDDGEVSVSVSVGS